MAQKQFEGLKREEAARWIATNTPIELSSRISSKAITPRQVEEWRDRYGGKYPPDDIGGQAFKMWGRRWDSALSKKQFREICQRVAQWHPKRGR